MSAHTAFLIFVMGLGLMALGLGLMWLAWRLRFERAVRLVFTAEEERDLGWVALLLGNLMAMVGGLLWLGADASVWVYMLVLSLVPIETVTGAWLRLRARRAVFDRLAAGLGGEQPEVSEEDPPPD